MITAQETLGVDAARIALASNNVIEFNSRINWDVLGPALVVFVVLALVALWHKESIAWWFKNNWYTRWRETSRMRAEREKKLREVLSDNIQDAIDDAFLADDITAKERQWAFETIGRLGFPDLRSRAKLLADEAKLKEEPDTEASLRTVHVL